MKNEMQMMVEKYDLGGWYSGGGCQHYTYPIKGSEDFWIINKNDSTGDPDFDLPYKDASGAFGFSIDLQAHIESDLRMMKIADVMEPYVERINFQYGFVYLSTDSFEEGMNIITELSAKLAELYAKLDFEEGDL